jgi:hypothetical protein
LQVALATFDLVVYAPASQKEADEMNPSDIYNKTKPCFDCVWDEAERINVNILL